MNFAATMTSFLQPYTDDEILDYLDNFVAPRMRPFYKVVCGNINADTKAVAKWALQNGIKIDGYFVIRKTPRHLDSGYPHFCLAIDGKRYLIWNVHEIDQITDPERQGVYDPKLKSYLLENSIYHA